MRGALLNTRWLYCWPMEVCHASSSSARVRAFEVVPNSVSHDRSKKGVAAGLPVQLGSAVKAYPGQFARFRASAPPSPQEAVTTPAARVVTAAVTVLAMLGKARA